MLTNKQCYFNLSSLVKETGPEVAEDGSSFDHTEIVHLDYTGLLTTLVDLLHVI